MWKIINESSGKEYTSNAETAAAALDEAKDKAWKAGDKSHGSIKYDREAKVIRMGIQMTEEQKREKFGEIATGFALVKDGKTIATDGDFVRIERLRAKEGGEVIVTSTRTRTGKESMDSRRDGRKAFGFLGDET